MFAPGSAGIALLAVVLVLAVVTLVTPAGRRAAQSALGSVGRWPGLIRSELRGDAPLDAPADSSDTGNTRENRPDRTTPDIPVVPDEPLPPTRSFPQVGRRER